jgi:hypothetical protein
MLKSTYFLIKIETNCQEMPKFPGLDKLLDRYFWVSAVEKSRSRSRLLDFVSTSMSRPKSLYQEIWRDLKILAFLDSLSQSRSRSVWIFCIFLSRFLNPSRLFIIFRLKRPRQCQDFLTNLDCVLTNLKNLDASRQILTILMRLNNLDKNLKASKSQLKNLNFKNLDREKKS